MNRFWVHRNYATNDSMIKVGTVRGICLHISFINDCVPAEVVSELHQKEKKYHFVRERLDFVSQGSFLQET